ncbi:hypothetical protein Tdes44962_MAKER10426 [Teratosphaeria destructans]|uniref:Uncharacterized protein n=1 Tax=Teratosphaeria destructans TaxID=418781 RepID=A0A9W7SI47_9PEZI|nr:hypothetical protein Tdes44962_MAKER10426 [Teratosphaeria destructans]
MVTEMLALAAQEVATQVKEGVCRDEVKRSCLWGLDREDEDEDWLPPPEFQDEGSTLRRALRYLRHLPLPFSPPHSTTKETKSSRLFIKSAILNSTCDFVYLRSPSPSPHPPPPPPAVTPFPSNVTAAAEALVRAEATAAVWRYWDSGPEVRWKMVWQNAFGAARGSVLEGRSLDLGSLWPVTGLRVCSRRVREVFGAN